MQRDFLSGCPSWVLFFLDIFENVKQVDVNFTIVNEKQSTPSIEIAVFYVSKLSK